MTALTLFLPRRYEKANIDVESQPDDRKTIFPSREEFALTDSINLSE